jgi:hypothetical protein
MSDSDASSDGGLDMLFETLEGELETEPMVEANGGAGREMDGLTDTGASGGRKREREEGDVSPEPAEAPPPPPQEGTRRTPPVRTALFDRWATEAGVAQTHR